MPTNPETSSDPIADAKALIDKGHNLSVGRRLQDFPEILRCYGEAISLLEPLCGEPTNPLRDLLAVAYTHQGFMLLGSRDEAAFQLVLASFDRAIALRSTLLELGEPWFRFNLAGVWINRGDALQQRGAKERLPEALQAYDAAVRIVTELDSSASAAFAWRKAIARLNRGGAALRLFEPSIWDQAERDFDAALRELAPLPAPKAAAMASAWTGLGEIALRRGVTEQARERAKQALQALEAEEAESFETVQTGLRARLLLGAISRKEEEQPGQNIRAAEITAADQIEEGLALALRRPERPLLLSLIVEAFVHCSRAYAKRQPQFLAEFLREFMGLGAPELESPQMLKFAVHEIDLTLSGMSRGGLPSMQRETIAAALASVTSLRELRAELAAKLALAGPSGPGSAGAPLPR